MDKSIFLTIPHEILVDLLLLLPPPSVINFYLVSSAHLPLFDADHGFWEQLTRKILGWSAFTMPIRKSDGLEDTTINWKKEYRVVSFFNWYIRHDQIRANASPEILSKLESISNTHFKAESALIASTECYTLQSSMKLYPLPVGNFTTAYFEVQIINSEDITTGSEIIIGGAIEGFQGGVGTCITSYGFGGGLILLERGYCLSDPQREFHYETGDTAGFGVNFANKSVFFTINGHLVHETDTNVYNQPLLELKNLHATISMGNHEVNVNVGSAPFMFDLLKYQQQHAHQPLELYSSVVKNHLVAALELTADKLDLPSEGVPARLFANYNNLPNFDLQLPEFFYTLLYGQFPPNIKCFANYDADYRERLVSLWQDCRSILSSEYEWQKITDPTQVSKEVFDAMGARFEIEGFESMTWQEQMNALLGQAARQITNLGFDLLFCCTDELAKNAFDGTSPMAHIYNSLLAIAEYFTLDHGEENWARQIVSSAALQGVENTAAELQDVLVMYKIMALRFQVILPSVLAQTYQHLAQVKTKEMQQMMILFGHDDELENGYVELIDNYLDEAKLDLLMTLDRDESKIAFDKIMHNDEYDSYSDIEVLYGIYYLKLQPQDYASPKEFKVAACKKTKQLITDDTKHQCLLYLQKTLHSKEFEHEAYPQGYLLPLTGFFKVDIGVQVVDINDENWATALDKAQKEIERMLATKNYGPAVNEASKSTLTQTNLPSMIGTVAAIAVIGLSVWWMRNRFAK